MAPDMFEGYFQALIAVVVVGAALILGIGFFLGYLLSGG